MVTRRTFLQGLVAGAAALVLPPTLADNAEAAKRFWALDSTMLETKRDGYTIYVGQSYNPYILTTIPAHVPAFVKWVEAYEPRDFYIPKHRGLGEKWASDRIVEIHAALGHGIVSVKRAS